MKKILSLSLVCVMLLACLVSCGSLERYSKKLENEGYKIEVVNENEIKYYAEEMGLEVDETGVVSMLYAAKADGLIPKVILIMECASKDAAEKIANEADSGLGLLGMRVVTEGKFVLAGTSSAVEDALA